MQVSNSLEPQLLATLTSNFMEHKWSEQTFVDSEETLTKNFAQDGSNLGLCTHSRETIVDSKTQPNNRTF